MSEDYGLTEEEIDAEQAQSAQEAEENKQRDLAFIAEAEAAIAAGTELKDGLTNRLNKARERVALAVEEEQKKKKEQNNLSDEKDEDGDDDDDRPIWLMFGSDHFTEEAEDEIEELFYNDSSDPVVQDKVTARLFAYYLQLEGQRK